MKKNFLLIGILFLAGCASVEPFAEQFNILSVPEERKMGIKMAQEISRQMPLESNPAVYDRVNAVAIPLVSALPHRDFDYQFLVVRDSTPNAFTIPGGFVYVHTGLLKFVDDDDELAGVLAHEIGHAYERHPARGLSRALGVQYLTDLLFAGTKSASGPTIKSLVVNLAQGGILTRYSRDDESRADQTAFYLLRRAGLPSDGLLRFLAKLQRVERGGGAFPFLSSHPPTPERIARLQALERGQVPPYHSNALA